MIFELVDIYLMKIRLINIHDVILSEIQGAKLDELITFEVDINIRARSAQIFLTIISVFFQQINKLFV